MKKDLRLYLIRHGRTVWNEQGLMQGWGNSALTEQGVKGAQLTGQALAEVPFIAAYSSCLQRTIDTANYILGERSVPLFQHIGLNEQFFGSWEGTNVETIRQTAEFQQMVNDPKNYQASSNGGETWQQVAERAMKAMQDIIDVHHRGDILIVSHGHTLRLLLALFAGATWQNHREQGKSVAMLNTAINMVRYVQHDEDQAGKFIIERLNDAAHLG
ncbi:MULTISPECIES: histidine phosphatase family protein [Basfia]|uniref:phosphoglycerate mutase (2,3-diphosphoglycerate-dependent) n=2 Tax=Basfia TaxID=697331 RepID=Q65TD1_MANSM|nr:MULTISPECIES: histidine phosphatase family protein [Basfia]AAU37779.1 GpmB protein [[Mannheimia] succiniciproducens MBEL55E]QIM68530.1 phosphoglycerate mutase [Basfia succiniciproducens]SCX75992.1 probable phosphoglycerate mutase [Basfia succiniciproducens]SEP88952.1 probable phosphoglycerate mutase [Basfia succiniciproducens]